MTTIALRADVPGCYPTTPGFDTTKQITTAVTTLAVFSNISVVENLRAILKHISYTAYNPSADTLVTFQLVSNPTVVGGSFVSILGSELILNLTATITGGKACSTLQTFITTSQGNSPQQASYTNIEAVLLGLELHKGDSFALVANTRTALSTANIAWSANWLEVD